MTAWVVLLGLTSVMCASLRILCLMALVKVWHHTNIIMMMIVGMRKHWSGLGHILFHTFHLYFEEIINMRWMKTSARHKLSIVCQYSLQEPCGINLYFLRFVDRRRGNHIYTSSWKITFSVVHLFNWILTDFYFQFVKMVGQSLTIIATCTWTTVALVMMTLRFAGGGNPIS